MNTALSLRPQFPVICTPVAPHTHPSQRASQLSEWSRCDHECHMQYYVCMPKPVLCEQQTFYNRLVLSSPPTPCPPFWGLTGSARRSSLRVSWQVSQWVRPSGFLTYTAALGAARTPCIWPPRVHWASFKHGTGVCTNVRGQSLLRLSISSYIALLPP